MKQEPQRTEKDIIEEFATKLSKAIDTELIRQKYKNRANIKDGGRVICEIVFVKWFEDTLHSYTAQREQAVREECEHMVDHLFSVHNCNCDLTPNEKEKSEALTPSLSEGGGYLTRMDINRGDLTQKLRQNMENQKHYKIRNKSMTTPRIEKLLKKIEYNSHDFGEQGVFIRVEYAKNISTEAHQAGDKDGYERGKQAGRDEAVEIVKKHSYYAKFGFNTTAETIAVSPPLEKRICDTDDTIKALQDKE